MKILRISLCNLASLGGEHTVDFTRAPLLTSGLFSISGQTGSGKSTLLDALCLALYNNTPRLKTIVGAEKIPDANNGIGQEDSRTLVRRGAAEAYAEVCFVGVDGGTYTARWKARRARLKPTGTLLAVEMTLHSGNVPRNSEVGLISGGKTTEVKQAIVDKVGLTFDQFRRAILLAQGDFATFLKSKDNERAEILEALTGTERFTAISIAIFERYRDQSNALQSIEAKLEGSKPLSPEARAEADDALQTARNAQDSLEKTLETLKAQLRWFADLDQQHAQVNAAKETLEKARAASAASKQRRLELAHIETASMKAGPLRHAESTAQATSKSADSVLAGKETSHRDACALRDRQITVLRQAEEAFTTATAAFEHAQPQLKEARGLDATLSPLLLNLETATRELKTSQQNLSKIKDDLEQRNQEIEKTSRQLAQYQSKVRQLDFLTPYAADLTAWKDRLSDAHSKLSLLATRRTELENAKSENSRAIKNAHAAKHKEESLRKTHQKNANALNTAESAVKAHDQGALITARRNNDSKRETLRELELRIRDITTHEETLKNTLEELQAIQTDSVQIEERIRTLESTEVPSARQAERTAAQMLEIVRKRVSDAAKILRASLVAGEACPVCGGKEHPFSNHESEELDSKMLRDATAVFDKAKATLDGLEVELVGYRNVSQQQSKQRSLKQNQIDELRSKIQEAERLATRDPEALRIWSLKPDQRKMQLDAGLNSLALEKEEIEQKENLRRQAEDELKKTRKAFDDSRSKLDVCHKEQADTERILALAEAVKDKTSAALSESEQASASALALVDPLLTAVRFPDIDPVAHGKQYIRLFTESAELLLEARKQQQDFEARLGNITPAVEQLKLQLNEASAAHEQRLASNQNAEKAYESTRQQRAALFGGEAADKVEGALKNKVDIAKLAKEAAHKAHQDAMTDARLAAQSLEDARGVAQTAKNQLAAASAALDSWVVEFNTREGQSIDREVLGRWLAREKQWIDDERASLNAIDAAVTSASDAVTAKQQDLLKHESTRPTADTNESLQGALEALQAELLEARKHADLQRAVILDDDNRRTLAGDLAAELEEKRRKIAPWVKLNTFIGSTDGAKFRRIAQQWTLDVLLKYANAQLNQLSARYQLKRVDNCLNLAVVDRDMSDEIRSIHSLSGGELFLVSLGLALGLASLTSNRLRIESLFIDEGFGSLDTDTLRTAMDALKHLEAQGRKVGVISHVTEMVDAIPVQIRVAKGPGGASRIVLPYDARKADVA